MVLVLNGIQFGAGEGHASLFLYNTKLQLCAVSLVVVRHEHQLRPASLALRPFNHWSPHSTPVMLLRGRGTLGWRRAERLLEDPTKGPLAVAQAFYAPDSALVAAGLASVTTQPFKAARVARSPVETRCLCLAGAKGDG